MSELLLKLLPFIFSAVNIAEKIISKPKTGEEKKALVMQSTETALTALNNFSTGGQKETWNVLSEPVSNLIDASATLLFKK